LKEGLEKIGDRTKDETSNGANQEEVGSKNAKRPNLRGDGQQKEREK